MAYRYAITIPFFFFNFTHQHFSEDKANVSEASTQSTQTDQQHSGNHKTHHNYMFDFEPSGGCNETDLELGRYKPTHTLRKASTDEGRPMQFKVYRLVWFSVAFLVLSMFLCLFLYVFRIIK